MQKFGRKGSVNEFRELFISKQRPEWVNAYIQYNKALLLIDNIERNFIDAEKDFVDFLAKETAKVEDFYQMLIAELEGSGHFKRKHTVEQLSNNIQQIENFALMNTQALKNIIAHHDDGSKVPIGPSYLWKTQRDDFCSPKCLENLLMTLSEVCVEKRKKEQELIKAGQGTVQDDGKSIEGGKVVRQSFERTSIKFWIPTDKIIKLMCTVMEQLGVYSFHSGFSQMTSSVYFDDDNLNLYANRLVKEEGSSLIRFRWYGKLDEESVVFIERKVHHEKWVMQSSVKERCSLKHKYIMEYIKGEYKGDEEYVQKHPLFRDVQTTIIEKSLKPILKTEYMRTAFQIPDDDSVRLTLDTQLNMLRELDTSELNALQDWHTPTTIFQENRIHRFPFAVLEVKLHAHLVDNPPKWLHNLFMSDMLIRMDKFSKYNHGTAVLYPEIVQQVPFWFGGEYEHFFTPRRREKNKTRQVRGASFFASPEDATATLRHLQARNFEDSDDEWENLSTEKRRRGGGHSRKASYEQQTHLPFPNKPPGSSLTFWQKLTQCKLCEKDIKNADRVSKRMRIEPKTFFANERTYLQWFNAAALLTSVSLALMTIGQGFAVAGYVVIPLIFILMAYSLTMYLLRTSHLESRTPTTLFADTKGPTLLAVGLCVMLIACTVVLVQINNNPLMRSPIQYRSSPLLEQDCNINITLPDKTSPRGLAYNPSTTTLFGSGDGVLFNIDVSAPLPRITSVHVPRRLSTAKVFRNITGLTFAPNPDNTSPSTSFSFDYSHLLFGEEKGNSVYLTRVSDYAVVQEYTLESFPFDGYKGLASLLFVTNQIQQHISSASPNDDKLRGGYLYVANNKLHRVYIYSSPSSSASSNGPITLSLVDVFEPMQGATKLTSITPVPSKNGKLMVGFYYESPNMLAIYGIDAHTGLPSELEEVRFGFDLNGAVGVTSDISQGYSSAEYFVSSDKLNTVIKYGLQGSQFSQCITYGV